MEARKKLLARRFLAKRSKPQVRGKVVKVVNVLSEVQNSGELGEHLPSTYEARC